MRSKGYSLLFVFELSVPERSSWNSSSSEEMRSSTSDDCLDMDCGGERKIGLKENITPVYLIQYRSQKGQSNLLMCSLSSPKFQAIT